MATKIERIRLHTGDRDIVYSLREQVRSLEKLDEENKRIIAEYQKKLSPTQLSTS
jgi:precorrin-4 methylase